MIAVDLQELERQYPNGIKLLREHEYYSRLLEEVKLLVKYFDNNYFFKLLTENLFDDIRGVFISFVNKDLKFIYYELQKNPNQTSDVYLNREYNNLLILKNCAMSVKYQVSGLMRLPQTRTLPFKSSFLQFISRKLNGEIQKLYRELSDNYKRFFRKQFIFSENSGSHVSLACMEKLNFEFEAHFLSVMEKFYALAEAIYFVHDLFTMELRKGIQQKIGSIFYENQDKMSHLLNYFIDDLKQNFIKILERQLRNGRKFTWIQKGFLMFLDSKRFETLLRKVILQSITAIHTYN